MTIFSHLSQFSWHKKYGVGNTENPFQQIFYSRFVFCREKSEIQSSILSPGNVLKNQKNVSTYFNHYYEFLVTLKLIWGNIEKSSNFWEMFFSMSIFNRETISIVLFQLQSYKLTRYAKCLKKTFFSHFYRFLGGVKLPEEILKNNHIFSNCSTSCIFFT